MSKAAQGISCLFVLNARVAGATFGSSSMADVEIWPEVQTPRSLEDGQKS